MRQTLQELLDYAEACLDQASNWTLLGTVAADQAPRFAFYQQQSMAASQLAQAVAIASAVKYDDKPAD